MHDPSLDEAQITALRSLDPDGSAGLLPVLFREFKQQSLTMVEQLEAALGDHEALAAAAHSHKGAAASMGARALANHLQHIEHSARNGRTVERQLVHALHELIDSSLRSLAVALGVPHR